MIVTLISRSTSRYANGCRTTPYTTLYIAVAPPIPNASVQAVTAANPGLLRRDRALKRMSRRKCPSHVIIASNFNEMNLFVGQDGSCGRMAFGPAGAVGRKTLEPQASGYHGTVSYRVVTGVL